MNKNTQSVCTLAVLPISLREICDSAQDFLRETPVESVELGLASRLTFVESFQRTVDNFFCMVLYYYVDCDVFTEAQLFLSLLGIPFGETTHDQIRYFLLLIDGKTCGSRLVFPAAMESNGGLSFFTLVLWSAEDTTLV